MAALGILERLWGVLGVDRVQVDGRVEGDSRLEVLLGNLQGLYVNGRIKLDRRVLGDNRGSVG